MHYLLAIFLCFSAMTEPARAGEILLLMLSNAEDQSAISGRCTYEKSDTILQCTTVQISMKYSRDPNNPAKDQGDLNAELEQYAKTDADVEKFCKAVRPNNSIAEALKNPTSEQQAKLAVAGPITMGSFKDSVEMCKHPTRASYRQYVQQVMQQEEQRCKVDVSLPDTDTFKKVSPTKWVSIQNDGNACQSITTTLEKHDKYSLLWTWTDVPAPPVDSKRCRAQASLLGVRYKPLVFSWQGGPFPMHCTTATFNDL